MEQKLENKNTTKNTIEWINIILSIVAIAVPIVALYITGDTSKKLLQYQIDQERLPRVLALDQEYSFKYQIKKCEEYLSGNLSEMELCDKYGVHFKDGNSIITDWIPRYLQDGADAFLAPIGNRIHLSSDKISAVEEYIKGKGSLRATAAKYGIPSKETLRQWVLLYNANRELKDYIPKSEVYMAEARRKTTIEERKEIVEYCINHNRNYKETASIYDVSYSQVYSWVKKYDKKGDEGLTDKRGRHKTDDELDELERLRRENKRLKRKLEEEYMLVELLKKVKEFEGM